ncbi:surface polysaccharide O-acyltransferase-like enzyme [Nocardiopsis mwathae]|uniref:Surface polysaccharide O-acyltransferase-like enzyme n=1 Tax=Nocardiopsis mwathae TaxID=1472723 RepID=A0A7W9YH70_9ACTN|nr:acyltransferase family protein [Nocardiopsis mwathae]MBB6172090.1 surface polysaccharide O-acyltransferase-like enzyme [Nocardiopsis mwathae]
MVPTTERSGPGGAPGAAARPPTTASAAPATPPATAWLDLARVSAMLAVVAVHVFAPVVTTRYTDLGTATWWAANAVDASFRWCVPVFIMISGALLLRPREERLSVFYRRRFSRIGIPLVVWVAAYLAWEAYRTGITPGQAAGEILSGTPSIHLYFLFVLAGLYLLTPFLRVFVEHATVPTVWWFAGLMSVIGMADQAIAGLDGTGEANAVTRFLPFVGYYVIGYLLRDVTMTRGRTWGAAVALLLGTAATAMGAGLIARAYGEWGTSAVYLYDYLSPTVLVMSIAAYLLFRAAGDRFLTGTGAAAHAWRRRLRAVSDVSFGVFLVHVMVLFTLRDLFGMPDGVAAMLVRAGEYTVAVLLLSLAITVVFKRIPGLRATV